MIPSSFDYVAASTVAEAVQVLSQAGDDAKILAGGQSLVPVLRLRLAAPTTIVDLNKIDLQDLGQGGGFERSLLGRGAGLCPLGDPSRGHAVDTRCSALYWCLGRTHHGRFCLGGRFRGTVLARRRGAGHVPFPYYFSAVVPVPV